MKYKMGQEKIPSVCIRCCFTFFLGSQCEISGFFSYLNVSKLNGNEMNEIGTRTGLKCCGIKDSLPLSL